MDMQTPDQQHDPAEPASRPSPGFTERLLKDLAAIIPADAPDRELREQDMRELFESLQPRDAADAQLAAFAIAAVHAAGNGMIRAAGPDVPDETAAKLRSGARCMSGRAIPSWRRRPSPRKRR